MWLWFICIICFVFVVYKTTIVPFFFWKKRGIPHRTPLPLLGNFAPVVRQTQSFYFLQQDVYNDFPHERYNGFYQLLSPTIFIRDLDLLKDIGVKHFDHFMNHTTIANDLEPFLFRNLFSIQGQEWKQMRSFLSPAFTSSKMKNMFDLIAVCARRVATHYDQLEDLKKDQILDIELKDVFTRYANDVIATCAFGLECDSLTDKENAFYMTGKDCTDFGGMRGMKVLVARFAPAIFRCLNIRMFPKESVDFFIDIIKNSIAHREQNNVVRPDILHLLLEARKGKLKHDKTDGKKDPADQGFAVVEESDVGKSDVSFGDKLTDVDIASQCFLFFFAGFETASTMLSFTFTELAINPDIQDKLYSEIDNIMYDNDERPSYDDIMRMKYLDMVVTESLRKWPPAPALDRVCTKDFIIEPIKSSEKPVTIKSGDIIAVPILGIQRDPKYFPNPERFDPERFSDENKQNIVPYSYLPFGVGPRACIGSRFALLEAKILLVQFLHKFEVVVVDKTTVPISLTKVGIKVAPDNGFWVGLKRRISTSTN